MVDSSRLGVFVRRGCLGCLLWFGLSACGLVPDRSSQYKTATQTPSLKVPDQIQAIQPVPLFGADQISGVTPDLGEGKESVVPRPDPMELTFGRSQARVVRVDKRDQLVIVSPPQALTQRMVDFFELADRRVERRERDRVLVVDWARYDDQREPKVGWFKRLGRLLTFSFLRAPKHTYYQIRFTIDTTQFELARIDLGYRVRQGEKSHAQGPWLSQLGDDETLPRILGELVEFIEREPEQGLGRQGANLGVQSHLESDANGYPVWVINQSFARAWENLLIALRTMGPQVVIDDLDRSLGLFYIKAPDLMGALELDGDRGDIFELRVVNVERGVLVSTQLSDEVLLPKPFSLQFLTRLKGVYEAQD